MTLNKEQQKIVLDLAKPLMKWLNDHAHPHITAVITQDSITIQEAITRNMTTEFVKD